MSFGAGVCRALHRNPIRKFYFLDSPGVLGFFAWAPYH